MAQINVRGFVPISFQGAEFGLRILEADKIEGFYKNQRINTRLRYAEGYPLISVRGELSSQCKPGDQIVLTLETNYRAGKKGIRNLSITII